MKPSDLDSGSGRIRYGMEELTRVWGETSEEWSDAASRSFQEEQLDPLGPIVKRTLDAVGRMRQLLHDAQRDLES